MRNKEFKEAVGKFPTGVTVISTKHDDKLWGLTANSFVSVSLTPHLVSFCLNRKSGSFKAFDATDNFAISILANDQSHIAKHFARTGDNKFLNIDHEMGVFAKAPMIKESVCFIECTKYKHLECGDHTIFVGEVMKVTIDSSKSPLVYFAKSYKGIQ